MQPLASTSRSIALPYRLCVCARRQFTNNTPVIHPIVDRVPAPKEPLTTVSQVLRAAGRDMQQFEDKFDSWESLFEADGTKLKDMGLSCKDRKYLMRQLQWYRLGFHPQDFQIPVKKKKTFRGHGDRIQNGKLVPEKKLFRLSHRRSIRRSRHVSRRNIRKYSPLRTEKSKRGRIQRYGYSWTYRPTDFQELCSGLGGHRRTSWPTPAELRKASRSQTRSVTTQ